MLLSTLYTTKSILFYSLLIPRFIFHWSQVERHIRQTWHYNLFINLESINSIIYCSVIVAKVRCKFIKQIKFLIRRILHKRSLESDESNTNGRLYLSRAFSRLFGSRFFARKTNRIERVTATANKRVTLTKQKCKRVSSCRCPSGTR